MVNIEYACSICGGKVDHVLLACYPGIDKYTCRECGAKKETRRQTQVHIVTMPGPLKAGKLISTGVKVDIKLEANPPKPLPRGWGSE